MYNYAVKLKNIKLEARHGLYDEEKNKKQLFEIDLEACFDRKEGSRDNIKNSIDYEKIYQIILEVVNNNTFNLLETIGEKIINQIFKANNTIKSVKINIRKPQIKFDDNSNCVEVSISKENE